MPRIRADELRNLNQTVGKPLKEIWNTKVPRLIFFLFLHVLSESALLGSYIPALVTNYFANSKPGEDAVDCVDPMGKLAEAEVIRCRAARDVVLAWKCGESIIAYLIVGVLLSPSLGRWSDFFGRKPFLCLGCGIGVLIPLSVVCNLKFNIPFWWYYFVRVIVITFTPFLPALAYVADVVSPPSRTIAFALTGLVFGFAYAIGPALVGSGAIPGAAIACYICIVLAAISCIACLFFIPESLTKGIMESSRARLEESFQESRTCTPKFVVGAAVTFWGSFSILFRNRLFQKLTLCIFVLYLNFEEVYDTEAQYFQEVAHFGTKDLAMLFSIAGVAGLFIITIGIWSMVSLFRMSDKAILITGMVALAIQQILYIFIRKKLWIYIATALGTTANLVFPAINSIKSRNVRVDEQGALQGAIMSAQSVAKGISPILFLVFFKLFRKKGFYHPGAPFFVGLLFLVGGIVLAFTLKVSKPLGQHPARSKEDMLLIDSHPLLKAHSIALSSISSDDFEDLDRVNSLQ